MTAFQADSRAGGASVEEAPRGERDQAQYEQRRPVRRALPNAGGRSA